MTLEPALGVHAPGGQGEVMVHDRVVGGRAAQLQHLQTGAGLQHAQCQVNVGDLGPSSIAGVATAPVLMITHLDALI